MSLFSVQLVVSNYDTRATETIEADINPQVHISKIPASLLERLGVELFQYQRLPGADGEVRSFPVGYVLAELTMANGETAGGIIKVVFGPEDECFLGRLALQGMAVELDPASQSLVPMILHLPSLVEVDETGKEILRPPNPGRRLSGPISNLGG